MVWLAFSLLFPSSSPFPICLCFGEGHCCGLVISMRMNVEAGIQDKELNKHALVGIFHVGSLTLPTVSALLRVVGQYLTEVFWWLAFSSLKISFAKFETSSLSWIYACIMFPLVRGSGSTVSLPLLKSDQQRRQSGLGGSVCFPTDHGCASAFLWYF